MTKYGNGKLLRKMRQNIFKYTGGQAARADRVLLKVKAKTLASPEYQQSANQSEQRFSEEMLRRWA